MICSRRKVAQASLLFPSLSIPFLVYGHIGVKPYPGHVLPARLSLHSLGTSYVEDIGPGVMRNTMYGRRLSV